MDNCIVEGDNAIIVHNSNYKAGFITEERSKQDNCNITADSDTIEVVDSSQFNVGDKIFIDGSLQHTIVLSKPDGTHILVSDKMNGSYSGITVYVKSEEVYVNGFIFDGRGGGNSYNFDRHFNYLNNGIFDIFIKGFYYEHTIISGSKNVYVRDFFDNVLSSTAQGGALRINNGSDNITIKNIVKCNNTTYGGGVSVENAKNIKFSKIEDCRSGNGGGLFIDNSTVNIDMLENCNGVEGGGCFVSSNSIVSIIKAKKCIATATGSNQGGGVFKMTGFYNRIYVGFAEDCNANYGGIAQCSGNRSFLKFSGSSKCLANYGNVISNNAPANLDNRILLEGLFDNNTTGATLVQGSNFKWTFLGWYEKNNGVTNYLNTTTEQTGDLTL